jgi:hypothetical protein
VKRVAMFGAVAVCLVASAIALPRAQQARPPTSGSNVWERSRQCSEQAAQIVAGPEFRASSPNDVIKFNSWSNHYNVERERCYLAVSYFGSGRIPTFHRSNGNLLTHLKIAKCRAARGLTRSVRGCHAR